MAKPGRKADILRFHDKSLSREKILTDDRRQEARGRPPRVQRGQDARAHPERHTPAVLASRILGGGSTGALAGGTPLWKYVANRAPTLAQNLLIGAKLSEYQDSSRRRRMKISSNWPAGR